MDGSCRRRGRNRVAMACPDRLPPVRSRILATGNSRFDESGQCRFPDATIEGAEEQTIRGLLAYLMPVYTTTHDIVVLDCIIGLQAVCMLRVVALNKIY